MEETAERVQTFLKEFTEPAQSPCDNSYPKIIGNYSLHPEEVTGQVIDWIFNYLENRKCPYQLALTVARKVAQLIDASVSELVTNQNEADPNKLPDSLTLYAEAINRVSTVCTSLLEKINEKDICSTIFSPYSASVFAIKNKRRKMEDRHVVHHDLNSLLDIKNAPHHCYYAVFDGHSGIDAASYASAHLHINIVKHPAFLTDTPLAISEAYKITDNNFLKRCSKENVKSGSTAISALIRENTMYLSWLGDSQAVLVKQGQPVVITNPHKPEREDEKKRIEDLGGHVTCMGVWRVNGILAVTRALGDPDHKPFISCEPEINVINLDQTEDFLILACDGLWDGMSPDDVTTALYCYLSESAIDEPLDTIAAKLVHQSKLHGSEDNITTIVVFLRDIKDIKEDAVKYMASLSQASAQMREFLSVNGDMRSDCTTAPNVSFSKPTVLELNAASSKKLKNTANVLSSAGFGNSAYSYSYSENSHSMCSQIASDFSIVDNAQNAFMSHPNTASCFAPEATALSELPTPPIDDVLALQNFEQFSSSDLNQNLDSVVSETCQQFYASGIDCTRMVNESEISTQFLCGDITTGKPIGDQNTEILSNVEPQIDQDEIKRTSKVPAAITPDEAVGIASSVVSNAIETAVKSLSSETHDSVISHSPLNPYAEPFVMKSFYVTEDNETKIENVSAEKSANLSSSLNSKNDEVELVKPIVCEKYVSDMNNSSPINLTANESDKSHSSEILDSLINATAKESDKSYSCEILESPVNANATAKESDKSYNCEILKSPVNANATAMESDKSFSCKILEIPVNANATAKESDKSYSCEVVESTINATAKESDKSYSCEIVEKVVAEELNSLVDTSCGNLIDLDTSLHPNLKNVVDAADSVASFENTLSEKQSLDLKAESELNNQTESLHLRQDKIDVTSHVSSEELTCTVLTKETVITKESHEKELKIQTEPLHSKIGEIDVASAVPSEKIAVSEKEMVITKELHPVDKEKCKSSEQINLPGDIAKDSIPLLNMQNKILNSTENIGSSDHIIDDTVETFAVDLKSVPDGVPEAEGVTEDIDSDSEKDGGWSYMKGNTDSAAKPKNNEQALKVQKGDISTKLKNISKPVSDIKTKVKYTATEKTKKVDKKIVETKDKEKSKIVKSSTLNSHPKTNLDKASRTISTVSRTKRDAVVTTFRVTATTTTTTTSMSKVSRPTFQRNIGLSGKSSNVVTTEKSLSSVKSSTSSNVGVTAKPKTVSSVLESKSNIRPTSSVARVQPSNQSNKSSTTVRSAPNRLPSSVPSKASSMIKPLPSSKSAPESKAKQPVSTIRKTVPSLLKKPDVKETKDSVNKQISAGKNTGVKVDSATSAVVSNKTSAAASARRVQTLNNKSAISKLSSGTSIKTDLMKKDVPKIPPSRIASRNTVTSKLSKEVKGSEKKPLVQSKSEEKKMDLASCDEHERNVAEIVSEEEKFILETNDKEIVVKEQSEIFGDANQALDHDSSAEGIKPMENQTSVPCSSEGI